MIREDEILYLLYKDPWFRPNQSDNKKALIDRNGNRICDENGYPIDAPMSYYKVLKNGTQLAIRVSNHGTNLKTWVEHRPDPTESLQNVSVVFSGKLTTPELKTKEVSYKGKDVYCLWKRCDNGKYFYAKLVNNGFEYDRKWAPLILGNVPKVIQDDIDTIIEYQ